MYAQASPAEFSERTAVLLLNSNASLHEEQNLTSRLSQTNGYPSYTAARESHSSLEVSRSTPRKPTVHYPIHKRPPLVPTVGHSNSVPDSQSYFRNIHFNIILSSIPRCYNLSPSVRFPHQTL